MPTPSVKGDASNDDYGNDTFTRVRPVTVHDARPFVVKLHTSRIIILRGHSKRILLSYERFYSNGGKWNRVANKYIYVHVTIAVRCCKRNRNVASTV